jgi:hypothetical protein
MIFLRCVSGDFEEKVKRLLRFGERATQANRRRGSDFGLWIKRRKGEEEKQVRIDARCTYEGVMICCDESAKERKRLECE